MSIRPQAKTLLILSLLAAAPAFGGDASIKPDPIHPNRYRITDSAGNPTGSLKPDPIHPNRYQITDQAGNRVGAVVQSPSRPFQPFKPFHPSATPQDIQTKDGRRAGTIKPDPIHPDRFRILDRQGNPAGTGKPDNLQPERWTIEKPER
jgi:hypothetical protein